jgi:hypothetical protein
MLRRVLKSVGLGLLWSGGPLPGGPSSFQALPPLVPLGGR